MLDISFNLLAISFFVCIVTSGLSGCGEISYKRGGSAQDVSQAHAMCRGTDNEFSKCLAQQGWDPLFAAVSVTDNRPNPTLTSYETKKDTSERGAPAPSTINDGPNVSYNINSWWKMGAGPEALNIDQQSCETALGARYKPDYLTNTFKRAFLICMHDKGWITLRNPDKQ